MPHEQKSHNFSTKVLNQKKAVLHIFNAWLVTLKIPQILNMNTTTNSSLLPTPICRKELLRLTLRTKWKAHGWFRFLRPGHKSRERLIIKLLQWQWTVVHATDSYHPFLSLAWPKQQRASIKAILAVVCNCWCTSAYLWPEICSHI